MAKKTTKKIDVKKVAKGRICEIITKALEAEGIAVHAGEDYGFSFGTVVAVDTETDVQVKLITPKAGVTRYEKLEDEDEGEAIAPAEEA